MQYWLGANERTHVLPTDKWYLDFATSILPLVKTSPLFNKEDLRTQIDAAISLGMYFQDAIAQSGGWKLFSEAFQGVYGTYLPFYPLGDDYTPDEINQEDIAFVLWTLKSQFSIFDKEYTLFSPYDKDLLALSQSAYELMDARFEEAPISEEESSFLWVMGLDLLDMPITPLPEVTPETKLSKDAARCLEYSQETAAILHRLQGALHFLCRCLGMGKQTVRIIARPGIPKRVRDLCQRQRYARSPQRGRLFL